MHTPHNIKKKSRLIKNLQLSQENNFSCQKLNWCLGFYSIYFLPKEGKKRMDISTLLHNRPVGLLWAQLPPGPFLSGKPKSLSHVLQSQDPLHSILTSLPTAAFSSHR